MKRAPAAIFSILANLIGCGSSKVSFVHEDSGPKDAAAGLLDAGPADAAPLIATPDAATPPLDAALAGDAGDGSSADVTGQADASGPADAGSPPDAAAIDVGPGAPISAPARVWTWVDFPDSSCDDGSPTGIGVSTSSSSRALLIFFEGGGACWDFQTCVLLNTSVHGPYGQGEFMQSTTAHSQGIFDRSSAENVFRDWSFVYVPYCTGDVHAGDHVATYTLGSFSRMVHHKGHANFLAYLRRLGPTFPAPTKLVISGMSGGGYGAALNFSYARAIWPNAQAYLIDDSGPVLEAMATNPQLRDAWFSAWNLAEITDPLCGAPCRADLSLGLRALAARYPGDRLALLESLQDQTIRSYYGLTAMDFERALIALATDILDPTPNFRYFYVPGDSHTMLGAPQQFVSQGTMLWDWIREEVRDEPGWASTR